MDVGDFCEELTETIIKVLSEQHGIPRRYLVRRIPKEDSLARRVSQVKEE